MAKSVGIIPMSKRKSSSDTKLGDATVKALLESPRRHQLGKAVGLHVGRGVDRIVSSLINFPFLSSPLGAIEDTEAADFVAAEPTPMSLEVASLLLKLCRTKNQNSQSALTFQGLRQWLSFPCPFLSTLW